VWLGDDARRYVGGGSWINRYYAEETI